MTPDAARLAADWETLSTFRDPSLPGWTRRPFTPAYMAAREWLAERMRSAGLSVSIDAGGNLIGVRPGNSPSIMIGSHSDTVMGGGRFDGMVGVLAAIEVARCLADSDLRRTLEVVDFLAEEPTDLGISTVGSRAMAGALTPEMLALRSDDVMLADAIASVGGHPASVGSPRAEPIALYLELHIEQGPVLESEGLRLGIVTAITGIARFRVRVRGRADHAGTMPMALRRDALAGASAVVLALEELWRDGAGVGTVGRLFVSPNATNVVPGEVELWAEMRSVDAATLRDRAAAFARIAAELGQERNLDLDLQPLSHEEPVPISERVQSVLAEVVTSLGHQPRRLPSYAGHDANQLAKLAPIGMLFIPSRAGRSHCPEEWTDLADVALGASALLNAVQHFDTL
ncbi:MAG TPA: M20 family metallo-hydrolase [Chloroflexota bacterium]|jgi:N-carbamoyl-L-amino-acid hydrolase|nr:M20 family metallo-hydrolase [Chloroflexota bacterium]